MVFAARGPKLGSPREASSWTLTEGDRRFGPLAAKNTSHLARICPCPWASENARDQGGMNGSGAERAERQPELPDWRARTPRRSWRSLGREPVVGHEAGDRVGRGRGLDPAHRTAAASACIDVLLEHMLQQPSPSRTCGAWLALALVVAVAEQRELIALAGWRAALACVDGRLGDDLGAERGVTREHAQIPK